MKIKVFLPGISNLDEVPDLKHVLTKGNHVRTPMASHLGDLLDNKEGPGYDYEVETRWAFTFIKALTSGKKIMQIKLVRTFFGVGLKEAKDMVEGGDYNADFHTALTLGDAEVQKAMMDFAIEGIIVTVEMLV